MDNRLLYKQLTDEELAARAQAGSRSCFEELVCRYSPRLFHYLRHKISNDQDIEDLVQETFLKAYQNIGRFNLEYKFSTWLYTITNRLRISYFRKKGVVSLAQIPMPEEKKVRDGEKPCFVWKSFHDNSKDGVNEPTFESAVSSQNPQVKLIQEENYKSIWTAAQTLQQYQYEALWLRYIEDMSVQEIAKVMKKTQIHVRVLLHRARSNLIKRINQPGLLRKIEVVCPIEKNVSFS